MVAQDFTKILDVLIGHRALVAHHLFIAAQGHCQQLQ